MGLREEAAALLSKEMDRKDFIKHIGIALVLASGIGAIIKSLSYGDSGSSRRVSGPVTNAYGSSPYGGTKK